jgi:hypothetical protein
VLIRLFQSSSRALKVVHISRVPAFFQWIHLDWTHEPHPRFSVEGHILSIGGDALRDGKYQTNHLIINRVVVFFLQTKSKFQTNTKWLDPRCTSENPFYLLE